MTKVHTEKKSNTINHNALKHLIEAGSIRVATAVAEGDTWTLTIVAGEYKKIVMAKNSGKPRMWRKLETLTKYLKGLGLDHYIIDATAFDPLQKSLQRPDSAAILKRTHEAHKSNKAGGLASRLIAGKKQLSDEVKEKWEERRERILKQENPRAK